MDSSQEPKIPSDVTEEIARIGAKYVFTVDTPTQGAWLYLCDNDPATAFKEGIPNDAARGGFEVINNIAVMPFIPNPAYKIRS